MAIVGILDQKSRSWFWPISYTYTIGVQIPPPQEAMLQSSVLQPPIKKKFKLIHKDDRMPNEEAKQV